MVLNREYNTLAGPVLIALRKTKAEVRRSFITTTVREQRPRSHHKGATGGFELATNSIQFYAIANLDT